MKIGILTIFGGSNYGNKLQNYALQKFLETRDFKVETIAYTQKFENKKKSPVKKIRAAVKQNVRGGIKNTCWNLYGTLNKCVHRKSFIYKVQERNGKIREFEQKNIKVSKHYSCKEELWEINDIYDYVIAGSDQIWNPYWQGAYDVFFLNFVEKDKRIAYAPSFGVASIPDNQISRYTTNLCGFSKLSCRELTGAKMIERLTAKTCEHVVDPVFLLARNEWQSFVKDGPSDYVLTYFLGKVSLETSKAIKKYASDRKLRIINIYNMTDNKSVFPGIEEFLSLIANASMFFTDSFHGCAFSVIFGTQFIVCDRSYTDKNMKMNSRIDDLLHKIGLGNRYIKNGVLPRTMIDFVNVYEKLDKWVIKSQKFLLNQLL